MGSQKLHIEYFGVYGCRRTSAQHLTWRRTPHSRGHPRPGEKCILETRADDFPQESNRETLHIAFMQLQYATPHHLDVLPGNAVQTMSLRDHAPQCRLQILDRYASLGLGARAWARVNRAWYYMRSVSTGVLHVFVCLCDIAWHHRVNHACNRVSHACTQG